MDKKNISQRLILLMIIFSLIFSFNPYITNTVKAYEYTDDLITSFDVWIQGPNWQNATTDLMSQDLWAGNHKYILVEWDLSTIPSDANISNVKLKFWVSLNDASMWGDKVRYFNCTCQPSKTSDTCNITWGNLLFTKNDGYWSGHCYNITSNYLIPYLQEAIDSERGYFAMIVEAIEGSYGHFSHSWRSTRSSTPSCYPTLRLTYDSAGVPILTNPVPSNGAVNVDIPVTTSIDYSHSGGLTATLRWYYYDSGWILYATDNGVTTGSTKSNTLSYATLPNTIYQWKIQAEDSNGTWTNTSAFSFTTAGIKPPTNVQCSSNGTAGINVTFTKFTVAEEDCYFKELNINTTDVVGLNHGYQMFINVSRTTGPVNCSGHCNANFSDVRFWDIDKVSELNYWVEKKVDGEYAWFWVKLPTDISSDGKIHLRYDGNSSRTTTSNGDSTFIYFENWNMDNTSQWDSTTYGDEVVYTNTTHNSVALYSRIRWRMNVTVWNTIAGIPMSITPCHRLGTSELQRYKGLRITNTQNELDSQGDMSPVANSNFAFMSKIWHNNSASCTKYNWTHNSSGSTGAVQGFLGNFYDYQILSSQPAGNATINCTMSHNDNLLLYSYATIAEGMTTRFLTWIINNSGNSHTFAHANSEYLRVSAWNGIFNIIDTYTDWMFTSMYSDIEPSISSVGSEESGVSNSQTLVYYSLGYTPPIWGTGTFAGNTTGELVEVTGLNQSTCYAFSLWTNYYNGTWTRSSRTTKSPCCTEGADYILNFRYENTTYVDDGDGVIEPTDYFNNIIDMSKFNCSTHRVEVYYEDLTTEFYYLNATYYSNPLHVNASKNVLYITVWWNWSIIDVNYEGYNCDCTFTNSYKRTLIPNSPEIGNNTLDFYFITDRHIYNDYYIDDPASCDMNVSYIIDNNLARYYFKFDDRTMLFDSCTGLDPYATIYCPNATQNIIIHQEYWDSWQRIYPTLLYDKDYFVGCNSSEVGINGGYECVGVTPNKLDVAPNEAIIIINKFTDETAEFASNYDIDYGWQSGSSGMWVSFFDSGYNTTAIKCSIKCRESGLVVYEYTVAGNEWNFTYNAADHNLSYIVALTLTHNKLGQMLPITFTLSYNIFIASYSYIETQLQIIFGNLPANLGTGETIRWIMLPVFIIGLIPLSIFGKFNPGIASLGVGFWMFGGNFMLNIDTLLIPGFFLIFMGILMFISGRSKT